jgi:ferritin-like metal-binding protein YciE
LANINRGMGRTAQGDDMAGNTLRDSLVDEVKDMYNAEKQLTKALPKLAKAANSDELRTALESHLEETQNQVSKLERVFELLDETIRGKHCAGMAGIIEEGADVLEEDFEDAVMDAAIIAAAQKTEHYEIGSYGTMIAWAEALELTEVAGILKEILDEEKAADEKLSAIAESGINDAATAGESYEEEEETTSREKESARVSASGSKRNGGNGTARSAKRARK